MCTKDPLFCRENWILENWRTDMDNKEKLEIATRIMEATLQSPALGNIPGNLEEIKNNVKSVFLDALTTVIGVTKNGEA